MVISVYEKEKLERLKEKNIVIETIYYNPNNNKDETFIRSTDGKMNDIINYKAIKEKRYFLNNECIFVETGFDQNALYNIVSYNDENEVIKCMNCGHSGKVNELIDGCPYCKTIFNFGANDINNSKKQLEYQFHFKDYFKIYLLVVSIVSIILFCILSSNNESYIGTLIYSIVFALFFSVFPSLILITIYLIIKQHSNPNYGYEDYNNIIWKISKSEKIFYNNLKAELMIKLYEQKDLIDFEILDYLNIEFLSEEEIIITCKVREVYYQNKIKLNETTYKIKTRYNKVEKDKNNIINCLGCGKSIDVSHKKCDYCNRINDSNNEWVLETIEKI